MVEAASTLIHEQGFGRTTLADIARESDVPLGNVYYYFKTKEDIGAAVVEDRAAGFRSMFSAWERDFPPRDALMRYLDMVEGQSEAATEFGCPIGSLCQELDKSRSPLSRQVDDVVRLQLSWVTRQFEKMGLDNPRRAALDMMTGLHGAFLVANALKDDGVVVQRVGALREWLESL